MNFKKIGLKNKIDSIDSNLTVFFTFQGVSNNQNNLTKTFTFLH